MSHIKKYDEFLNEKIYNADPGNIFDDSCAFTGGAIFLAFFSLFLWLAYFGANDTVTELGNTITFWVAVIFDTPMVLLIGKELARKLYYIIRSKFMLKSTVEKYENLRKVIKNYPDLEKKLDKCKKDLDDAVKKRDKERTSECITEVYELSEEIAKRVPIERDWEDEDEQKSVRLTLREINNMLKTENLSNDLRKILIEIKKVVIHYEQTDEYPFNFITVDKLSEEESTTLKKFGFGIFPSKKDKGRKDQILWKWR